MSRWLGCIFLGLGLVGGCGRPNGNAPETVAVPIQPSADDQTRLQTALIEARPGAVIELAAGIFRLTGTLSLDVERVTIRGQGPEETRLVFAEMRQGTGGEGLSVTSGDFTLADLAIEDTQGDALKVNGANGVTIRRVRVEWMGGPQPTNGSYGIYPVLCQNVLIEDCFARGASDAGIYVGQSENIIVRRNKATENVAGIEIENSLHADVHDNELTNNAGGILVFTLPDLVKKEGRGCRVFHNQLIANNHPNFAPAGNIVAEVPSGTGVMVMASDEVEIFDNTFRNNGSSQLSIISYLATQRPFSDQAFDPYTESVFVHDNRFEGGGDQPQGDLKALALLFGGKLPDMVCDASQNSKLAVEGKLPPSLRTWFHNNGDADFARIDLPNLLSLDPAKLLFSGGKLITRDLEEHTGELPPLAAVQLAAEGSTPIRR